MITKRKLIYLGIIPLVLSPLFSVISCSVSKYSTNDIGGLNNEFNQGSEINNELVEKVKWIRENGTSEQKELLNQKTILLTTGGEIRDQSFNQSTWEAISKFSREIGNNDNSYFETKVISQSTQSIAYDYAIAKGYKIWILTGFQQERLLTTWLKIGKNSERFKKEGIKIITVDWFPGKEMLGLTNPGTILGLNFKTQQAAFVTAYSAAKLLTEINDDNENPKEYYFNTFAGGDFSGATNFNYGFLQGIWQYNQDKIDENKKEIKLIRSTSPFEATTGFALTQDARAKVEAQVDGGQTQPKVIFPVAGTLTSTAIDRVKNKKQGQWVIGVDTDQSLAFPNDKDLLLTSVEKRISIAIYKALITLYGIKFDSGKMQNKMNGFLEQGYSINEQGLIVNKDGKLENYNVEKGYSAAFVGVSKSTLDPTLKFKKIDKTYAKRFDEIVEETWNDFFGTVENNFVGRFEKQNKPPSEDEIKEFANIMIPSDKLPDSEEVKKVLEFTQNILYGYMTANNLKKYFNPIIDAINNQQHKK